MESNLIQINGVWGYKRCPQWLKKKYRIAVKFTCPRCKKHETIVGTLQIHRKKRGGLYTALPLNHPDNNCDIDCSSCHKKLHQNEFKNCKSK